MFDNTLLGRHQKSCTHTLYQALVKLLKVFLHVDYELNQCTRCIGLPLVEFSCICYRLTVLGVTEIIRARYLKESLGIVDAVLTRCILVLLFQCLILLSQLIDFFRVSLFQISDLGL